MALTERETEKDLIGKISMERLMADTAYLAEMDRESCSPGEERAVEYFRKVMQGLGLEVSIQYIENYLSLPVSSSVEVLSPEPMLLKGLTPSFSANTPPQGLELEMTAWDPGDPEAMKGKAVLRPGLAAPVPSGKMECGGVAAQVWINWGELPNNSTVTTIWGHPVPETAHLIPKTPVVSLGKSQGEMLMALCRKGPVKVRIRTELEVGFKKVPLAVADLPGAAEPDKYVLFNAHIDAWHKGATDNATANACMLEAARILAPQREKLVRGVRFIWWSGHSQGRYSGSTWYVDHHWEDLHKNAICHFNADCLGCKGATDYSYVECTAELYDLGREIYRLYTGQDPRYERVGHAGDNSFWGVGLPSLYLLASHTPPPDDGREVIVGGLSWFWHTEADTIDKVDPDIFLTDVKIYLATLWRLCTEKILPMNFAPVVEELGGLLRNLRTEAGGSFDLAPAFAALDELASAVSKLNAITKELAADNAEYGGKARLADRCLMGLSRLLMPINYTSVSRFDFDLATEIPPLARLRPLAKLASLDPASEEFKFLERKMLRELNRLCHALNGSVELIRSLTLHMGSLA